MDRSIGLARSLEERGAGGAQVAVVEGSGLGGLSSRLEGALAIDGAELDDLPASSVPGHDWKIVVGELAGVRVIVQEGRVHLYEGRSTEEVTRSVRSFAKLGCAAVVLANAAGGLHREWSLPQWMRITDHIDLQGAAAIAARDAGSLSPYDEDLGEALDRGAAGAGIRIEKGVYAGLVGPAYETPAEIRMLAWMGADAVGMSTVAEAQAARCGGARVVGLSCITNHAAGISPRPLDHREVLAAAGAASSALADLLERSIAEIAAARRGR